MISHRASTLSFVFGFAILGAACSAGTDSLDSAGSSHAAIESSGTAPALFGAYTLLSINGNPVTDPKRQPAQIVASTNVEEVSGGGTGGAAVWTTDPHAPAQLDSGSFDVQITRYNAFGPSFGPPYVIGTIFVGPDPMMSLPIGSRTPDGDVPDPPVETGAFGPGYASYSFNVQNAFETTIYGGFFSSSDTIAASVTETAADQVTAVVQSMPDVLDGPYPTNASQLVTTTYVLQRN